MSDSPDTPQPASRSTRFWRSTTLALVLSGMSLVAVACGTTATTSDGTTSTTHAGQSSGTTPSSEPATGSHGVAAVCTDVHDTQAIVERTKIVPADEAQKILADSQSSGNAKLEAEASTLASASHVVDQAATVAALTAMAATCHEVTAGP
jgi:hypothetical protein